MDPITTAILAVLPALASDMVKSGVKDAYEGLKAVIHRKWGDAAPISEAITAIEKDPNSKAQAAVLEEKVAAVKAAEDADVVKALQHLVEQMTVARMIQFNMSGGIVQGVAGAENVQIGSMTFGAPSSARQQRMQAEVTKAKEILNEFDRKAVSDEMHEENIYFMIKSLESVRIAVQTLGKSTVEDQQLSDLIETATRKIIYINKLASELRTAPGKWQNSIFDLRIFGNSQPTVRFDERISSGNGKFDQAMEMVQRRIKAQCKKALNVDQVRARDIWDNIGPHEKAERDIDNLLPDVPVDVDTLASDFAVFYVFGMLDQVKQDIVELMKFARARVSILSAELDK
jgi:hypothetical protein